MTQHLFVDFGPRDSLHGFEMLKTLDPTARRLEINCEQNCQASHEYCSVRECNELLLVGLIDNFFPDS